MKLCKNFKRRGFMVVEMLVAVSIITASVLVMMGVAQKSIYVSRQALHNTQAAFLLEEGAEVVRILRDNGWSNIGDLSPGVTYYPTFGEGVWALSETESAVGIFTRTVIVENVSRDNTTKDISDNGANDAATKLVNVTVTWMEGGVVITKTLPFYLIDIFS